LILELKEICSQSLLKTIDRLTESPAEDMWIRIRQLYISVKEKVTEQLAERLKGFQTEQEEVLSWTEQVQQNAFKLLRDKFKEKSKYLPFIMTKRFEEKFNSDEQGLPRRWKPTDNISDFFLTARKQAENLLEKFSILRLTEELETVMYLDPNVTVHEVDPTFIILSYEEAQTIKEKFFKEAESSYKQALRDQENISTRSHIPMYVIVMLIVLGFDEFVHVITNPLLFMLFALLGITFYVLYLLNLLGPVRKALEHSLNASLSGLQAYLSEQMNKHNVIPKHPQEKKDN